MDLGHLRVGFLGYCPHVHAQDILSSQYENLGRGCCVNASTEAIGEDTGKETGSSDEPFESHSFDEVCIVSRQYVFDSRYPSCRSFYHCFDFCHNATECSATNAYVRDMCLN